MAEQDQDKPTTPDTPDQYDPGDSSYDPVLDAQIVVSQPDSTPEPAHGPPRGPDGKFLPKPAPHDSSIVAMALDLGMDQAEIDLTPQGQLLPIVHQLHRQSFRFAQGQQNALRQPEPVPIEEEIDIGLDKTIAFEESLVNVLKSQARELRDIKRQILAGERQRQNESNSQYADRMFVEHGDPTQIGEGTVTSLKPGSPQQLLRLAAVDTAIRLAGQGATAAQQIAKIPAALKLLRSDKGATSEIPESREEDGLAQRRRDWAGAGLARPTHREPTTEPKGQKRAALAVHAKLREIAERNGGVGTEEEDSLPD